MQLGNQMLLCWYFVPLVYSIKTPTLATESKKRSTDWTFSLVILFSWLRNLSTAETTRFCISQYMVVTFKSLNALYQRILNLRQTTVSFSAVLDSEFSVKNSRNVCLTDPLMPSKGTINFYIAIYIQFYKLLYCQLYSVFEVQFSPNLNREADNNKKCYAVKIYNVSDRGCIILEYSLNTGIICYFTQSS